MPKANLLKSRENSHNETLILLDEDQQSRIANIVKSMYGAITYLNDETKSNNVKICTRHNALSIIRHDLEFLDEILGSEDDFKQNKEEDLALIRAANEEIRRLTQELAKGITTEGVGVKIGQLSLIVYNWWQELGFSYSKQTISGSHYGSSMNVEFSFGIDRYVSSFEEKPITKQKEIDEKFLFVSEELILIKEEKGSSQLVVLDCEPNREWIIDKLKSRFTDIRIFKIDSRHIYDSDSFCLWHLEANIPIESIENA